MNPPNPFRRHVHDTAPPSAAEDEPTSPNSHDNHPPQASTSTGKVRISSPATSPRSAVLEPHQRVPQASRDSSTPNLSAGETNHNESALHQPSNYDRRHIRGDEISESSNSDSEEDGQDDMADTMILQRPSGMPSLPYNPFGRTLASMEHDLGITSSAPARSEKELTALNMTATTSPSSNHSRVAMDVDAFKNLLMTGKKTQASTPPASNAYSTTGVLAPLPHTFAFAGDNSSSTDTSSSISRHSLIENMVHETPRTSYEKEISDVEDGRATMIAQRTGSNGAKPPPPKHKYGKSVRPKGPQIVSFAGFSGFGHDQSDASAAANSSEKPPVPSLDIPHPLPPDPPRRDSSPGSRPRLVSHESLDSAHLEPLSQKRLPPPPPLARRSSQRNTGPPPISGRSRSNTGSSQISIREDEESLAERPILSASNNTPPPPPPPARRSASYVSTRSNDDSPVPNLLSALSSSQSGTELSRNRRVRSPPLTPARHRTSSNISNASIPISLPASMPVSQQLSSHAIGHTQHPPPPPPPRRTSSKSSLDFPAFQHRRTSNDFPRASFDSERRPSISSSLRRSVVREEVAIETPSRQTSVSGGGTDILADMDAFQREIEGLMGHKSGGVTK